MSLFSLIHLSMSVCLSVCLSIYTFFFSYYLPVLSSIMFCPNRLYSMKVFWTSGPQLASKSSGLGLHAFRARTLDTSCISPFSFDATLPVCFSVFCTQICFNEGSIHWSRSQIQHFVECHTFYTSCVSSQCHVWRGRQGLYVWKCLFSSKPIEFLHQ